MKIYNILVYKKYFEVDVGFSFFFVRLLRGIFVVVFLFRLFLYVFFVFIREVFNIGDIF